MDNLNAENIKRGLACCKGSYDCFTCDIYQRGCAGWREGLAKDALALINSYERWNEDVEERLRHLLQSKTIREFDELDSHTKEYKKDISALDSQIEALSKRNEALASKLQEILDKDISARYVEEMIKIHTGDIMKSAYVIAVQEFQKKLCEERVSNDPVVIAANVTAKELLYRVSYSAENAQQGTVTSEG